MDVPVSDPVLIVAIAMASFLVAPWLSRALRLPDIIGLILLGMVIGPHALGILARDQTITLLGTVGLLYIVFVAALEIDLEDFVRTRSRAIGFGLASYGVPQAVGLFGGMLFLDMSLLQSLLLGSIFGSHTLLAYPIARRLGLVGREVVTVVIGGSIVTDTCAMLVLAVVAKAALGSIGPGFWGQLLLALTLYLALVFLVVPRLAAAFFRALPDDGVAHYVLVLLVLFACGYGAQAAGLQPILGAFCAGLALNRLVVRGGALLNRIQFIGNAIFIPFFLLSVGMLVDVQRLLDDWWGVAVSGFMVLGVVAGKAIGAWCTRLFFGYSKDEVQVALGLSVPQAAATLAAVLVGYEIGLFDETVINGAVVMILLTCMLGPILLERAGKRLITQTEAPPQPGQQREPPQRILVPVANPASAEGILGLAMLLRKSGSSEPLMPISVVRAEGDVAAAVAASERILGACAVHAAAADVPVSPVVRVDVNTVNGILRALLELRISTLVIGWTGPQSAWQRSFHLGGGIIDETLSRSLVQVVVTRLVHPLNVHKRIVLVVPPYAHHEAGFALLMRDIKLLSKRIGVALVLAGDGAEDAQLVSTVEAAGPRQAMTKDASLQGHTLGRLLCSKAHSDDLVVIIGCREDTISWNARWDRLPAILAAGRSDVSLVVAYPHLIDHEHAQARGETRRFAQASATLAPSLGVLHSARAQVVEGGGQLRPIIEAVLANRTLLPVDHAGLSDMLLDALTALDVNCAFVHAHIAGLDRPRLVAVLAQEGMHHEMVSCRALFLLFNPLGMSPENHLRNLALVARTVREPSFIAALLSSTTAGEAEALLRQKAG